MNPRLKHRWSVAHNYLAGITAGTWRRLLAENRFEVDLVYGHRAAFITCSSLLNSVYAAREFRNYGEAIAATTIREAPLFVLGHWRSGTTLLHYLLARDTDQFAFPNTYQAVNPHTFLSTESFNARRFAWLVPPKRPMDNMALSFQTPQEDEFAPALMTLHSPYIGISFARREEHYWRYMAFRDAPTDQVEEWKKAFLWFLKKLTLKCGRRLVLKSPPHTARIRLLLELFPDAQFVHVHRNPYRVFQSFRHYFDTAMWHTYLQRPELDRIDDRILRRYQLLYDRYFEDRRLIPSGSLHEIRFDDLERDPVSAVRSVYEKFGLNGFASFEPKLRSYVESLRGYQKNEFPPLNVNERRLVACMWERSFDEWKYPRLGKNDE